MTSGSRALDDWDAGQQHRDVADVNLLQLLAGAQPYDLWIGRVQQQSAGSHPLINVVDADNEAVDGYLQITDAVAAYLLRLILLSIVAW